VHTLGLALLTRELAKNHIEAERLGDDCLRAIVACAYRTMSPLKSQEPVEDSGLFVHQIKGLATHVAGLLGAYGPEWPVPKYDVIAQILRDHELIQ
jgi:hypothetical protein